MNKTQDELITCMKSHKKDFGKDVLRQIKILKEVQDLAKESDNKELEKKITNIITFIKNSKNMQSVEAYQKYLETIIKTCFDQYIDYLHNSLEEKVKILETYLEEYKQKGGAVDPEQNEKYLSCIATKVKLSKKIEQFKTAHENIMKLKKDLIDILRRKDKNAFLLHNMKMLKANIDYIKKNPLYNKTNIKKIIEVCSTEWAEIQYNKAKDNIVQLQTIVDNLKQKK